MARTREEVVKAIKTVIEEFAALFDDGSTEIKENTCPIGDIVGFDSLAGLTATVQCFELLDIDDNDDPQNLFIGETDNGELFARSIGQIADYILKRNK